MNVGIIIQARLDSTRLPKKVLAPLYQNTTTVIKEIIDRANLVKNATQVILATSDEDDDNELVKYLSLNTAVEIFRGSKEDVLDRYYRAAQKYNLQHIVRLTGDNPCIDPDIIDQTITDHLTNQADYTYTKDYPLGMNVEVVSVQALETTCQNSLTKPDREHVTYFIRNNPALFKLNYLYSGLSVDISNLRLTLDTPMDYLMIRILFNLLKPHYPYFGIQEILLLKKSNPDLFTVNDSIYQKEIYKTEKEELLAACNLLQKQEMYKAAELIKSKIEE